VSFLSISTVAHTNFEDEDENEGEEDEHSNAFCPFSFLM